MGQLYDLRMLIEKKIKTDGLDAMDVKGKIGLRAGRMLAFITATTPDEPEAVDKLKKAIKEILSVTA